MDVTEIGAIASAASAVLALIEKYGPEAWATIKEAVETTKSTTGPTLAEIEAIRGGPHFSDRAISYHLA